MMSVFPLPWLDSSANVVNRAFRIAVGDLISNIGLYQSGELTRPDYVILAGMDYNDPWTRDTAINTWNGGGLLFPAVARNTLLAMIGKDGDRLITGGQYWDAIIWVIGAWYEYLYSGDRDFLKLASEVAANSLDYFERTEYDPANGLFRGAACYGDGVAAYPDVYVPSNGSSAVVDWVKCNPQKVARPGYGLPMQALSTNCLYYQAYCLATRIAEELGQPGRPEWVHKAAALKQAINTHFWDAGLGRYTYLVDPFGGSQRQEGLGMAFAALFDVASVEQKEALFKHVELTPNGIACVYPNYERYQSADGMSFGRHAGTIWPQINGFWADAALKFGRTDLFESEFFHLATFAERDKHFAEIYHPLSGQIYGGIQEGLDREWLSCSRQTWCATAFIRMVLMDVCGMDFQPEGITFQPYLPAAMDHLTLSRLHYRQAVIDLTLDGMGKMIKSFKVNGKSSEPFLPSSSAGEYAIEIVLGE